MDTKQVTEIIKRLELGEPLSKITRDKKLPDASTVDTFLKGEVEPYSMDGFKVSSENIWRQAATRY